MSGMCKEDAEKDESVHKIMASFSRRRRGSVCRVIVHPSPLEFPQSEIVFKQRRSQRSAGTFRSGCSVGGRVHVLFCCLFLLPLQTDDKGVFSTDLSQEYELAASTFGLSRQAVWTLSQQAIDCIFAPEDVKQQLRQRWTDLKPQVLK